MHASVYMLRVLLMSLTVLFIRGCLVSVSRGLRSQQAPRQIQHDLRAGHFGRHPRLRIHRGQVEHFADYLCTTFCSLSL